MPSARHHFRETWTVAASPDEVAGVLADLEFYPRWWPEVVAVAALGEDRARVLCRSRLPYTLDLVLTAVTRRAPTLRVDVEGDLVGRVRFDLVREGAGTRLHFHQDVTVSGWLALASRVGRPALHWNHAQMMRGCREGLAARLDEPGLGSRPHESTEERSMSDTRALVTTERPARYGKQLTSHLGRKMGGEWDESAETGWVVLGDGRLTLTVQEGELVLDLEAPADDLERLEGVVGRHLVKFGAKDELVCAWSRSDGSEGSRQVMETEPEEG